MKNNILIWGMISFFITLGIVIPYVANDFNVPQDDIDVQGYANDVLQDDVTGTDIVFSIGTIWFWSFDVPVLFNLILLIPLRILFWFIIYDKFRGVGS